MKVSGFTFIRNGEMLGFPFIQSIQSVLPIVDEFVIAVGESTDNTLEMIKALNDPKIKIIETVWNTHMKSKGFVYGQQKMIAQYACTGDWAIYIEGDELIHENDYHNIRRAMETYLHDPDVEALAFDYLHFYGNINTFAWSPQWYRRAARIIKTSVRSYAPDGLYWVVLDKKNKKGRYPKAALTQATMYHYGWVRPEAKMKEKFSQVQDCWNREVHRPEDVKYRAIDTSTLKRFEGSHPAVLGDFFVNESSVYAADPAHKLTKRERKHRKTVKLEKWLGLELSKKHFHLVE